MKIKFSKEWFEKRIALEGDSEIGAGNPHFLRDLPSKSRINDNDVPMCSYCHNPLDSCECLE
jgi:hypothetical protein